MTAYTDLASKPNGKGHNFTFLQLLISGELERREKRLDLAISLNRPDLADAEMFTENDYWPSGKRVYISHMRSTIMYNM